MLRTGKDPGPPEKGWRTRVGGLVPGAAGTWPWPGGAAWDPVRSDENRDQKFTVKFSRTNRGA